VARPDRTGDEREILWVIALVLVQHAIEDKLSKGLGRILARELQTRRLFDGTARTHD
jgi:hypothetical protein